MLSATAGFAVEYSSHASSENFGGVLSIIGGVVIDDHKLLNAPLAIENAPPTALLVVFTA